MAKSRKNFGSRPEGWRLIGGDVPRPLAHELDQIVSRMPQSRKKLVLTAAIGLFASLNRSTQEALYRWADSQELDPEQFDVAGARAIVLATMLKSIDPDTLRGGEQSGEAPVLTEKAEDGIDVVYPPKQREGYVEQTIVTYRPLGDDGGDAESRKSSA